jgi:transcriptional regulator of arginine metabolism
MPPTKEKKKRLQVIGELIAGDRPIGSQEELVELLRERGIRATQASISRDLQELGIRRVKGRYIVKPWGDPAKDVEGVLAFVRQMKRNGPWLTLITTVPNAAELVAGTIDGADWPEVVGALGEDNIVFLATASQEDQDAFFQRIASTKSGARIAVGSE